MQGSIYQCNAFDIVGRLFYHIPTAHRPMHDFQHTFHMTKDVIVSFKSFLEKTSFEGGSKGRR